MTTSRPAAQAYELSDAEKRDLTKLIQEGKPLPEKYRFILFEDKREVELVWNGKTREVTNIVLPFQTLEHIDEPRKEKIEQESFVFDGANGRGKSWTNKLIWGDNKLILSSLRAGPLRQQIEDAGGLKLIYIDPPFDVGADFSMDIEIGGETFHKEPNLLEQIAYRDTWGRGADSFISMIYERLILMRDVLADDGSIYVHCDWRVNSYMRLALDEVFGKSNYVSEIVWKRTSSHNDPKKHGNIHDTLFYYSKTGKRIWNQQFQPHDPEYIKNVYVYNDARGRYRLDNLTAPGISKGETGQDWRGVNPSKVGRHWRRLPSELEKLLADGRIQLKSDGKPSLNGWKQYLSDVEGMPLLTIWADISNVAGISSEKLGYPTQKPSAIMERILKTSSNEGDLVADFFCGSGTTGAVAEKLGRKWIATDLGKFAIHTTRKRLIGVQRELKAAGNPFQPFEVLNLGRYERQAYLNISDRLSPRQKAAALARKEREFRDLILRAYRAKPLENDGVFHGKTANRLVVVGPINLPVGRLFVEELVAECRKRRVSRIDVLAFEFEMGLFPASLDEAKQKGIDLAPKLIPPEVFDKRAVEKGQVRFHDVSYIEATPRYDKKDKRRVAIELTDFSVYYTQGLRDAVAAELKEGKSEVICEAGKLIKLSKDKNGVVAREVLTKKWTDWVDYWAVDFDYQSRKEIVRLPKTVRSAAAGSGVAALGDELLEWEEHWTGGYIFQNQWQSFRTHKNRDLDLISAPHDYPAPGRYTIAVKVIDIFGNDTMTLVPVTVSY